MHSRHFITLGLALAIGGCYEQALVPGDEDDGRIEITNDEFVLDQRVDYPDQDVPIDSVVPGAFAASWRGPAMVDGPARAPSRVRMRLVAEADPPRVAGQTVQATSIHMQGGSRAIVSYNFRGTPALGALDFFQFVSGGTRPKLRSSATFDDTDVNAVTLDDGFAYLALASSDASFSAPAAVERLVVQGNKFTLAGNSRTVLESFAATSAVSTGRRVYVTTGSAGALFALDPTGLGILDSYPLEDARWVAWDEDGDRIVVAQGNPGRLAVFEDNGGALGSSLSLVGTYPFPGADVPEAKTTVEVRGGMAFVAAGTAGVQIVCLADGSIVGSVPRPDPASLGLDPSVVVTNAVTVDEDVMFISNGEAGVYVATSDDDDFDEEDCETLRVSVVGRLQFADLQSANHVAFRDGRLYVAAGLGGVKVVDVDLDD